MKLKTVYRLTFTFIAYLCFHQNLNAQCCKLPDSLVVKSVTDSSFCLKWAASDTSLCDTARSYELQFKPIGDSIWTDTIKRYQGKATITFCHDVDTCQNYQWRVRNICVNSGDSTFSAWVKGPKITMPCDSLNLFQSKHSAQQQSTNLQVIPNPARDRIVITGTYKGQVQISISNFSGKQIINKKINIEGSKLNVPVNISNLEKGMYFINLTDGSGSVKRSFIKQ